MKLQIEKGLFRLWIVFSAIWISVTLIKKWNNYTETRDAYIETWDANIRDADSGKAKTLEILMLGGGGKKEYIQYKKDALANWKTANIESIPDTLGIAFGIPLLLLIPYYILRWIVKGFIGKQSEGN